MRKSIVTLLFLLSAFSAFSQSTPKWYIGIELGGGNIYGELNEKWNIRQNLNAYNVNDTRSSSNTLLSTSAITYLGIKPEYHLNTKLSIASGVRLSSLFSIFEGDGRNTDYFFLRIGNANVTQSEYYRIKTISEDNIYLNIPLEFKYTPFRWGRVGFYGKLGAEIGFLLKNKSSIEFLNKEMQMYENEIYNSVGMTKNSLISSVNASLGLNYTTKKDWILNFDYYAANSFMTKNNSNLLNLQTMSGVQCSLMIPIHCTKKQSNNQ